MYKDVKGQSLITSQNITFMHTLYTEKRKKSATLINLRWYNRCPLKNTIWYPKIDIGYVGLFLLL